MPSVFVTRKIPESGLQRIQDQFKTEVWAEDAPPSKQVIIEKVGQADALVSLLTDKIDTEVLDAASNLRIIAQYAVGYDNIDVPDATRRGIYVTNTPGVLTETTADFAWALLMAAARRVVEADQYLRNGDWSVAWHPTMILGRDVYGATLGIVGMGRIGEAMAVRAQGFNMKILYYSTRRKPDIEDRLGLTFVDLDTLLQQADFVSLHVPLVKATHHLIDRRRLDLMKRTAFLINTSRGQVVDEKALFKALREDKIAGAGLDVFTEEPTPAGNPLLGLKNVVVAPHISSASVETRSKMAEMVAENLVAYFKGRVPPNLVNQEVLKVKEP
ncbi:MAG: D-glycerate dehydrogenase [Candidatus Bathyarchaeota archaeon]|nr:MAG: D-glycerate dehydrogenase [Candidatus Bathyarchaeota archaeon]